MISSVLNFKKHQGDDVRLRMYLSYMSFWKKSYCERKITRIFIKQSQRNFLLSSFLNENEKTMSLYKEKRQNSQIDGL